MQKSSQRAARPDPDFQCSETLAHANTTPPGARNNASPSTIAKSDPPTKKAPIPPNGEFPASVYFLRNNWADLGLLGAGCTGNLGGVTADKAKGATISFTRDYAGNNRIWAAQAMAGAVFSDCRNIAPGFGLSGFVEKSVAVYAQINSDYNSNATLAKKNNVDARTAGLSGEIAYLNGLDYNVLRVTPNVVFDNIKNTTAGAVMIQYVPVWMSIPWLWTDYEIYPHVYFQFDPTLDLQYASAMEHSQPLQFSGKDQSMRIGPELTVLLSPFGKNNSNPLANISLTETFHPWYEAYNGRGSYWWSNGVVYTFPTPPNSSNDSTTQYVNAAVAFTYNRGLDENSGTMTNQYLLSLTGKL